MSTKDTQPQQPKQPKQPKRLKRSDKLMLSFRGKVSVEWAGSGEFISDLDLNFVGTFRKRFQYSSKDCLRHLRNAVSKLLQCDDPVAAQMFLAYMRISFGHGGCDLNSLNYYLGAHQVHQVQQVQKAWTALSTQLATQDKVVLSVALPSNWIAASYSCQVKL